MTDITGVLLASDQGLSDPTVKAWNFGGPPQNQLGKAKERDSKLVAQGVIN